ELGLESRELPIGRPEIVSPMTDAVRLVDHNEAHVAAGDQSTQRSLETLGGEVDQLELAAAQRRETLPPSLEIDARIENRRAEAEPRERVDLILHQRD